MLYKIIFDVINLGITKGNRSFGFFLNPILKLVQQGNTLMFQSDFPTAVTLVLLIVVVTEPLCLTFLRTPANDVECKYIIALCSFTMLCLLTSFMVLQISGLDLSTL